MDTAERLYVTGDDCSATTLSGPANAVGMLSVLVTHATPSMATSVLATLRQLPGCEVRVVSGPDPLRALAGFEVSERLTRGGLSPRALQRVRDHVDAKLADRIELADLAAIADLSECHFARAFRQSMGLTPHRYVVWRRVERAARLLQETELPLSEVALSVGFSDQSHFTRRFTRHAGETPRLFRARFR